VLLDAKKKEISAINAKVRRGQARYVELNRAAKGGAAAQKK